MPSRFNASSRCGSLSRLKTGSAIFGARGKFPYSKRAPHARNAVGFCESPHFILVARRTAVRDDDPVEMQGGRDQTLSVSENVRSEIAGLSCTVASARSEIIGLSEESVRRHLLGRHICSIFFRLRSSEGAGAPSSLSSQLGAGAISLSNSCL